MSLLDQPGLRRALLALAAFAALSMALASPALADHGRRYGGRGRPWHPPFPRVVVGLPLPPVVIVAGPPVYDRGRYYGHDRAARAYDRGYEDGYDDGYDDRDREQWRRERYRRHRPHRDCDHDYYY